MSALESKPSLDDSYMLPASESEASTSIQIEPTSAEPQKLPIRSSFEYGEEVAEDEGLLSGKGMPPWLAGQKRARLPSVAVIASAILGAILLLLLILALTAGYRFERPSRLRGYNPTSGNDLKLSGEDLGWNISLSDEILAQRSMKERECLMAFPLNLPEIKQAVEWTKSLGGVTLSDVEHSGEIWHARLMIKDGRLFVKRFRPAYQSRCQAVMAAIHDAIITSLEPVPDIEFVIGLDDTAPFEPATWGLARRLDLPAWLVIDYGFNAWPEPMIKGWHTFLADVKSVNAQMTWRQKAKKLFWRGVYLSEYREQLRDHTVNESWADIAAVDWGRPEETRVSMSHHSRFAYVAATEGGDAYSGRLKYLLSTQSTVVSHPLRWQQHFHPALNGNESSPDQNIAYTKDGYNDIVETMKKLMSDPVRSEMIAKNAEKVFTRRYFSDAARSCYWRSAFRGYRSVMTFEPAYDGSEVDYESFMLMNELEWRPHK